MHLIDNLSSRSMKRIAEEMYQAKINDW